eukprot:CAMPEP_0173288384 /NCGR_PEP_ID=MMETSP1143-20121109/10380_1 /TAXON_ID=483371 /ORGANISM="non described non described, Strain CCMP2298" /LENGTH=160 /DNA_ID=CAMNT_0014227129 /DNA_START=342 /DNA_END=825 /DNA_ORIENTATION=-
MSPNEVEAGEVLLREGGVGVGAAEGGVPVPGDGIRIEPSSVQQALLYSHPPLAALLELLAQHGGHQCVQSEHPCLHQQLHSRSGGYDLGEAGQVEDRIRGDVGVLDVIGVAPHSRLEEHALGVPDERYGTRVDAVQHPFFENSFKYFLDLPPLCAGALAL